MGTAKTQSGAVSALQEFELANKGEEERKVGDE